MLCDISLFYNYAADLAGRGGQGLRDAVLVPGLHPEVTAEEGLPPRRARRATQPGAHQGSCILK